MNNLFNLRYLKLPNDCLHMIPGIGKLHFLQNMNGFSVKDEIGYSIQELQHMNELRQLRIKLLENVKVAEQACKAKICDKRNLTDLSLEWDNSSVDVDNNRRWYWESLSLTDLSLRNIENPDLDERVLHNLQPHNSLKELRIHAFMGVRSPIWLNNADLLSNLECIQLNACLEWQTLPPFGKLPFLKYLYLCKMPKAKSIDYNYHRNEKDCDFPSLKLLHIEELDSLEDWFDATITDDCFFPCLSVLYLKDCPNLKELPCLPPKLKSLQISKIGWKTLSCRSISKSIPLEDLTISRCPNITWIYLADKITDDCLFPCLTRLCLVDCPNLKELPYLPPKLKSLEIRNIGWKTLSCRSISNSIPLKELYIFRCPNITWIYLADKITRFAALRNLAIDLISLGGHQEVGTTENCRLTLDYLKIRDPSMLLMEPLRSIASLKEQRITHSDELVSFPSEVEQWFRQVSSSLYYLWLFDLRSLRFLPSYLESLSSLKRIYIQGVPQLQVFPNLPSSLEKLYIRGCHEELKKRYNKISGFDRDKLAHIPDVDIE